MKTGAELIREERERQIAVEKYDSRHDDEQTAGQLSAAAGCYIAKAAEQIGEEAGCLEDNGVRFQIYDENAGKWVDGWPWDKQYDKRKTDDKLTLLVKAGALISAEIDRIKRMDE